MIYKIDDTDVKQNISLVKKCLEGQVKYVYVITFGCQQNERDSETIIGLAKEMGYTPTDDCEIADLIVINTCAIRQHAEEKALSMLGRFKALKKKNPELIIGVVGCMAAEPHRAKMLKEDFHYVGFTLEPNMLHRIPELVARKIVDGKRSFVFDNDRGDIYEDLPSVRRNNHRAWVSIMYGCNNFCSYCIVPYVRGRERSRAAEDIISECRALVNAGVKEITLLGQNVNSYKSDIGFPELLSRIAETPGDFIIRFMTSHPKDTTDALIEVIAKHTPKIAPYFHLPLQSGSNSVLKKMNRTYTREKYLDIVTRLRQAVPNIALSSDIIVGFPSESDEDFENTMDILKAVRFDMVYAFLYSEREGTRAADFDCKVPRDVMDKRMAELLSIQNDISLEKNLPYENTIQRVLVDSFESREGETIYSGRTLSNKLVNFRGENITLGDFVNVKIEKACPFHLLGFAVE